MRLPTFHLPVVRWEYRYLYEKDEDYDEVLDENGEPVVADAWVEVFLLTRDNKELRVEIDREPFDKHILSTLLEDSLMFWRTVRPGTFLFDRRATMLEFLLAEKARVEG